MKTVMKGHRDAEYPPPEHGPRAALDETGEGERLVDRRVAAIGGRIYLGTLGRVPNLPRWARLGEPKRAHANQASGRRPTSVCPARTSAPRAQRSTTTVPA